MCSYTPVNDTLEALSVSDLILHPVNRLKTSAVWCSDGGTARYVRDPEADPSCGGGSVLTRDFGRLGRSVELTACAGVQRHFVARVESGRAPVVNSSATEIAQAHNSVRVKGAGIGSLPKSGLSHRLPGISFWELTGEVGYESGSLAEKFASTW